MERKAEVPFSSNTVRLSPREWAVTGLLLAVVFIGGPRAWERFTPFAPDVDYRIPYRLSNDYWHWARYCRTAVAARKTLIIGDSVVWGQYVGPNKTLSHYLGVHAPRAQREPFPFANMGVDGLHPAALAGLLQHYGRDIARRKVILHCNPLWMSSAKHDLQTDKEFRFNHPSLVPQFFPWIPCYTEPVSSRIRVVVERGLPFFAWAAHLRIAYFNSMGIPEWTVEHPYSNPFLPAPPPPAAERRREFRPWTESGIARQDFPWVELKTSFQWRCFQSAVAILRNRGNRVFVVVGPFNEHMLTANSLAAFQRLKEGIVAWLRKENIAHDAPEPLPSDEYADASHPLAKGYERLATHLVRNPSFRKVILGE